MTSIKLKVRGLKEAGNRIKSISKGVTKLNETLEEFGKDLVKVADDSFDKASSPVTGAPWAAFAPSTLKRQTGPLQRTGEMRRGISAKVDKRKKTLSIFSSAPHSSFQQFGFRHRNGGKVPARPFLPLTTKREIPKRYMNQLRQMIVKRILGENK